MRIKLAKYSATGDYLDFIDAFDSYIQLCGGGYTNGRPAFTFGTVFNRTVEIRMNYNGNEKSLIASLVFNTRQHIVEFVNVRNSIFRSL